MHYLKITLSTFLVLSTCSCSFFTTRKIKVVNSEGMPLEGVQPLPQLMLSLRGADYSDENGNMYVSKQGVLLIKEGYKDTKVEGWSNQSIYRMKNITSH